MDEKTGPQGRQINNWAGSLSQGAAGPGIKARSQTLGPPSLNTILIASWPPVADTEKCHSDLPSGRFCCPASEVWSTDSQMSAPSGSAHAEGHLLKVMPCPEQPTSRDQPRCQCEVLSFWPNTGHPEGHFVHLSSTLGWPRLWTVRWPHAAYARSPLLTLLRSCWFQVEGSNPKHLSACACHLCHQLYQQTCLWNEWMNEWMNIWLYDKSII